MRERTVAMLRIKNEARWIQRCLNSLWPVAQTIVIFDDGSSDDTDHFCAKTVYSHPAGATKPTPAGWILDSEKIPEYEGLRKQLHYIYSPFSATHKVNFRVNEIRDKNYLLEYVKAHVDFDYVVCLDGDEALSKAAIREFDWAIRMMERLDVLDLPVLYYWDSEQRIRIDGVYAADGHGIALLRFARVFTVKRLTENLIFGLHFPFVNENGGGFHCGSVPMGGFSPMGKQLKRGIFPHPIVHFGYIDEEIRRKKFDFYTSIDPNNKKEGGYLHIIGEKNAYCPGPLKLKPWKDD